ncbi:MAG: BspA family leucine-rich repeat surface protein [Muricauda sp.]|nr:BspA family leucine-rich repeat surface protein [Allomuricauda sp.]MBA4744300.1 BspA family leucine-rich repeat surface protein [Allomuricauda sp.]
MNIKNLLCAIISLVLLWSCGKDDGPEPAKNNAPKVEVQSFTVAEDISDSEEIGVVAATDKDEDTLIFSIVQNDNDLFEITESGVISLAPGKELNYELSTEHTILVSVSDGKQVRNGLMTITVTNVFDSMVEDPESFITKWEISSSNFELTIGTGTSMELEYDYKIDWGDGSPVEELTSRNPTHIYTNVGTYYVSIQGDFPHILMRDQPIHIRRTLKGIEQWGNIVWQSFSGAFALCQYMEYNATDIPNLENVQSMSQAFHWANLFDGDLSEWDVSNVTRTDLMFADAYSFNGDIGSWDVSNVTNMGSMFSSATKFNADISGWDVSNVTNMQGMFFSTETFNADISGWDVSEVTNMRSMFANNTSFNGDLSNWDVSNVTTMEKMFSEATSFNGDIGLWETGNVTDMKRMFRAAESFNSDIGGWNVSKVEDMSEMFLNAHSFNQNIGAWDIAGVEDMTGIFNDSGMSPERFSDTMIGWASNPNLQPYIPVGIEGMSLCSDNQEALDAMVFKLNIELEWAFSSPPDMVDCSGN